ncbi:MAG: VCBS repeat-containing protein [Bacteroidetes bacterium]|nr:MAG: VCBS repeat-containing protein [Bacteroidota bacterium]
MNQTAKIIIGILTMSSFVIILSSAGDVAKLKNTTKDSHVTLTESVPVQLNFKVRLLAIDSNEACEIADYNNDGILDISAGRNWYAGPDYVPRPLRDIAEFGKDYLENNGEHAIDMDGDGWMDILSGSFIPSEVSWYKNPGKEGLAIGKLWIRHKLQETASQNEVTYLHDFDGDNIPEYIANSWIKENEQLIWKIQAEGSNSSMQKCTIGNANGHGIGFGDINGDNREDILFENGWYERPPGDPLAQAWTLHSDWDWKHSSCPMIVTDLNGDGLNDVIRGSAHNYGLYWMEQLPMKEGKSQWKKHIIDDTWSQAHALAWVDLDGDGNRDLITGKRVRGHSGRDPGADEPAVLYYYIWNKKTKTFTRRIIAEGVGTGLFIRTADLDKNGKLDIVVSGKSGTYLLLSQ